MNLRDRCSVSHGEATCKSFQGLPANSPSHTVPICAIIKKLTIRSDINYIRQIDSTSLNTRVDLLLPSRAQSKKKKEVDGLEQVSGAGVVADID